MWAYAHTQRHRSTGTAIHARSARAGTSASTTAPGDGAGGSAARTLDIGSGSRRPESGRSGGPGECLFIPELTSAKNRRYIEDLTVAGLLAGRRGNPVRRVLRQFRS